MRTKIIILSLLAALAGCAWQPEPPSPAASALTAAGSCEHWSASRMRVWAIATARLPMEYVAAACARGWTPVEIIMRARDRGYIAGDCRTATDRRLLYAPCGALEGRADARERP